MEGRGKAREEKKEQKIGKGGEWKQREGARTKLHYDHYPLFPGDEQTSLLSHNV